MGAAVLRDGRLLAVRRTEPPRLAGLWEFPGGKVEPGETEHQALLRECVEELSMRLELGERVGPDVETATGRYVLRVYTASADGEPTLEAEHSEYRWLTADELCDVEWIPADLPVVAAVEALLRR